MKEFYPIMLYRMPEEKKNYLCTICTQRISRLFIADADNEEWAQKVVKLVNLMMVQVLKGKLDTEVIKKYQNEIGKLIDDYLYPDGDEEDDNDLYTALVGEGATIIEMLPKMLLSKGREKDEKMIILLMSCSDLMQYLSSYDSCADQKEEKWQIDAFQIIYDSTNNFPTDEIDKLNRQSDDGYIRWVENGKGE